MNLKYIIGSAIFIVFVICLSDAADAQITGVYRLTTKAQPTMCLEVAGSANVNGTAVQLNTAHQTANQQWLVQSQNDGTVKIYAFSAQDSLQMLDDNGGASGAAVHTWEDLAVDSQTDTNQRWYVVSEASGFFRLVPASAGLSSSLTLGIGNGDGVGSIGETTDIETYTGGNNQLFQLGWSGPQQILPNPKKGVPAEDFVAGELHCAWTYNWSYTPPTDLTTGIEFVPMLWNWSSDTNIENEILNGNPGMKEVLGFNEPDNGGQANMSVSQALQGFQYLSDMSSQGIQVGSPACADDNDSWMKSFMSQAVATPYSYHMDFVAAHHYSNQGGQGGAQDAYDLLGYVDLIHTDYGLPIWLTEFAPTDSNLTPADAVAFIRIACAGLNSRSYVQRYSIFTNWPTTTSGQGVTNVQNSNGTITAAGALYARE